MGRLVYYVEDDTSIRELVLYALKTSDFQVMGFEDAASFYQQIKKQLPDLILLDIMLPDEDGVSILKRLKQIRYGSDPGHYDDCKIFGI